MALKITQFDRLQSAINSWKLDVENKKQAAIAAAELAANQAAETKAIADTTTYKNLVTTYSGVISTLVSNINSSLTSINTKSTESTNATTSSVASTKLSDLMTLNTTITGYINDLITQKGLLEVAFDGVKKSAGSYSSTASNLTSATNLYNSTISSFNSVSGAKSTVDTAISNATKKVADLKASEAQAAAIAAAQSQTTTASNDSKTYTDTKIADLINSAPGTLDTLKELATALGNDANFSTTVTNNIASKAPIASPTFTGTVSGITKSMVGLSNVDNTQQLPYTQTLAHTGDVTSSATALNTGTVAMTLANSGVTAATYGSSTNIPQIAVDAKGRITSASNVAVSIPSGSISVTGGDITMSGSTGTAITNATLANSGVTAGTYTKVTVDAKGRATSGTTLSASDIPTLNQNTTGNAATATNVAWSGVTSKPTTVSGYGITDAAPLSNPTFTGTAALTLPSGTTAQRPTPAAGQLRFNNENYMLEFYDNYTWQQLGFTATSCTGGTITSDSNYYYHTFASGSSTFTVSNAGTNKYVDVIMWGAGGAGAAYNNVYGGGGGCVISRLTVNTGDVLSVNIGSGGVTNNGGCCCSGCSGAGGTCGSLGYGNGGRGGNLNGCCSYAGAGGGAASIILQNSSIVLVAGGGGGAGSGEGGSPGAGGGAGTAGTNGNNSGYGGAAGGNTNSYNGATIDAGGDQSAGGGGGGGYWGGGAGNPPGSDGIGAGGGGGGNNFVSGSNTSSYNGSGRTPGNSGDSRNTGSFGYGGTQGATGNSGWCQIRYPKGR